MLPLLQQTHDAAESVRLRAAITAAEAGPPRCVLDWRRRSTGPTDAALVKSRAGSRATPTLLRQEEDLLIEALMEGRLDIAVLPQGTPLPERLSCWRLGERWCCWRGRRIRSRIECPRRRAELASLRLLVPRHARHHRGLRRPSGTAGATRTSWEGWRRLGCSSGSASASRSCPEACRDLLERSRAALRSRRPASPCCWQCPRAAR
jgi:hypothetical protein